MFAVTIFGDSRDNQVENHIRLVRRHAHVQVREGDSVVWEMLESVTNEDLAWLFARDPHMSGAEAITVAERHIRTNF